jgi:predicted metal-dependent hydrolase
VSGGADIGGPVQTGAGALPPYSVRRSARARRIRLTVTARDGLVVTLPAGVAEEHARRAVAARTGWASRALAEVAPRREAYLGGAAAQLPESVELRAVSREIPVAYRPGAGDTCRAVARERDGVLIVAGSHDAAARIAALRRWRDRTARYLLPALLDDVSARSGIEPVRVTVRGQRTRWGSCSARGTISLNRNLVFLPAHLVRYVLAHELVHLRVLDHSPRFWAELESLVPLSMEARAELRDARHMVPVWADE